MCLETHSQSYSSLSPKLSEQSSDLAIRVLHLPFTASATMYRDPGKESNQPHPGQQGTLAEPA
jgi:hypothetical protein